MERDRLRDNPDLVLKTFQLAANPIKVLVDKTFDRWGRIEEAFKSRLHG